MPGGPAPTLGVVVPTWNEEARLPALLARLLDESFPAPDRADTVVVADGGSRDGTCAVARAMGADVVAAPRGRGAQLAAGAAVARGDVLLFLHADCVPAPGALAALREGFLDPGVAVAAMRQRISAEGRFYRLVERAADARARRGTVYGDSGLAVRRTAYEAVGGFRPLPLFEDVELSRRLAPHGPVRVIEGAALAVSPRRWRREGALRCTLRNWMLRVLYGLGVSAERLARLYPPEPADPPP